MQTTQKFLLLSLGLCVLTTEYQLPEGDVLLYIHIHTEGVLSGMHAY